MANKHRVAIIGRTGRGNYGHGLDTVWLDVPGAEIVAVADDHKGGLAAAAKRVKAPAAYADLDRFVRMLAMAKTLSPVADPADPATPVTFPATLERLLPGRSAPTRSDWLDGVALLTGHDRRTVDELDTRFGWSTPGLGAWAWPDAWERLARCAARICANVERALHG